MNVSQKVHDFSGGEWDPLLHQRDNLEKYFNACQICRNVIPNPQGGANNRAGTYFISDTKYSGTKKARYWPFVFSYEQAYGLIFNDGCLRFLKDGGDLLTGTVSAWQTSQSYLVGDLRASGGVNYYCKQAHTSGTFATDLAAGIWYAMPSGNVLEVPSFYAEADLATLKFDQSADILVITHKSYAPAILKRRSHVNWELSYISFIPTLSSPTGLSSTSGTGVASPNISLLTAGAGTVNQFVVTAVNGSAESGVSNTLSVKDGSTIQWSAISGATGYKWYYYVSNIYVNTVRWSGFCLGGTLTGTSVVVSKGSYNSNQPPYTSTDGYDGYLVTAIDDDGEESLPSNIIYSTPGTSSTPVTISWNLVPSAVAYNVYCSKYGMFGFMYQTGQGVNSIKMKGDLSPDFSKGPPKQINYFTGANDYPGCSCFHQSRLYFCRTNNRPMGVFCSSAGNIFSFNRSTPVQADDGFNFNLAIGGTTGLPEIKHMLSITKGGFVFSGSSEGWLQGYNNGAVTPTSIKIDPQSNWGCSDVKPFMAGNKSVLFVDRTGKRIRDLMYQITFDGYDTNDLTIMAQHLFKEGMVKSWCFVQYPQPLVHLVTTDGKWLTLAYAIDRGQNIVAWHRHDTDGLYEDVMALPNADGTMNVHFLVNRTINGVSKRYNELWDKRNFTDHTDGFFVDCGLVKDNPKAITAITKANPCVVTAASHGFSNGDLVTIQGVKGMEEINYSRFKIANVTTDTFSLKYAIDDSAVDSSAYTSYLSGGYARKATTAVTGLSHLEGKTVIALCDGRVERDHVVTSGAITLNNPAGYVVVGLPYKWQLKPMKFVVAMQDGSSVDRTVQVPQVYFRLLNTRSIYAAPDENTEADEVQLYGDVDNNGAMKLVSGGTNVFLKLNPETRAGTVCFSSDDPCPCTILDATARTSYGER